MKRIHILGASGSGTSTLGEALSKELPHKHLDTDDYFWIDKYTKQSKLPERRKWLKTDLLEHEKWILSGAVCGWGDDFIAHFDLIIFLWIPGDIRLERLRAREFQRYGNEVLVGGSKYDDSKTFLEWAALYDDAGMEVRSRVLHEHWMKGAPCPILKNEGDMSVEERVEMVLDYVTSN